jgi:putative transposase
MKIETHKENENKKKDEKKIKLTRFDLQKLLPKLKCNDKELKSIHSQVLQGVPKRLDQSFDDFFSRGNKGFPKFRSCRNFYGISYPQSGYSISNDIFYTKQYGEIKFNKHRNYHGNIKTVSITTEKDKWYLCITTDFDRNQNQNAKSDVGIDIGLKNLVVTSDGCFYKNKNNPRYFDKKISEVQSKMDKKKKKGSRSWNFLKKVRDKLYGAKINKINDFQHKASRRLSSKYDTIYIENLSLKKMSESDNKNLNKAIRNAKLAQLISFISYKANRIVLVNPYNTSKTCNSCGYIHKNLKLSDREITCQCGAEYDRDENAAKNVHSLGQAILELGLTPKCAESFTIQEALTLR